MKRVFVSTIVLFGLLAVFATGNSGTASSKAWQSPVVKSILAMNAGQRPAYHQLPSGATQVAVEEGLLQTKIPTGARPPGFPPTQNTVGCSNTYTASGLPDNVRANQICDLRRQAEVQIATNPVQRKNFVIGQNDSRLGYNRQGLDFTFDNGAHFGDYQPPTTQVDCSGVGDCVSGQWTYDAVSDPAVAWGPKGQLYYGLLGFDFLNDGYGGFWVLRSDAGLKGTFLHSPDDADNGAFNQYADTPVGLINDNFDNPNDFDDKEFITVDQTDGANSGNVYAVWTIFHFDDVRCAAGGSYCSSPIYFSKSTDQGATWNGGTVGNPGPPIEISGNNPDICKYGDLFDPTRDPNDCDFDQGAWPVVGPDGSINVAFNNCNATLEGATGPGECQQLFVKSTDGGATWTDPVKVGADFATEPLNVGQLGNGCPLFRQCLPPNGYRISNFPSMGVDNNTGKLVAFWPDFRNGDTDECEAGNGCNEDVFAAISTDGGATWGDTTQVTTNETAQFYPWGDVDEDGNLYVAYYTRQYGGCESTGCLDFRLSRSSNDGATWSTRRITTASMPNLTPDNNPFQAGFIGDYNSIEAAGSYVYMTWADTRGLNGTVEEDAYFAKSPLL